MYLKHDTQSIWGDVVDQILDQREVWRMFCFDVPDILSNHTSWVLVFDINTRYTMQHVEY